MTRMISLKNNNECDPSNFEFYLLPFAFSSFFLSEDDLNYRITDTYADTIPLRIELI